MALLTVFRGHVQGVGFRYQASRIARGYNVKGWVRNAPDGSVEIFLQGPDDEARAVLEEVLDRMKHHIRSEEKREVADDPSLSGFEVRL